jgi:hypothetical protein
MNQKFILEYAGLPVRFHHGRPDFVTEEQADTFGSETEALEAARSHNLNQKHCRAVDLNARNAKAQFSK